LIGFNAKLELIEFDIYDYELQCIRIDNKLHAPIHCDIRYSAFLSLNIY